MYLGDSGQNYLVQIIAKSGVPLTNGPPSGVLINPKIVVPVNARIWTTTRSQAPSGVWYYQVNYGGKTGWLADVGGITVSTTPVVSWMTPVNGWTNPKVTAASTWNVVFGVVSYGGVDSYRFRVLNSSGVTVIKEKTTTSPTASFDLPKGNYKWKCILTNRAGSTISPTYNFTINLNEAVVWTPSGSSNAGAGAGAGSTTGNDEPPTEPSKISPVLLIAGLAALGAGAYFMTKRRS
jgi:hypothetical protein